MKQLSTRAAHADNNRIITIGDIDEIEITAQARAESALSQAKVAIHIGECINAEEAKVFLAALNTGHCGCLVTPPMVTDDDTLQRIRRLMDEECDDAE